MRHFLKTAFLIFVSLTLPAQAQIGKRLAVLAGSPEDKALAEINSTSDPAQKLALMDKFMADYGKGDMAVVALDLYVSYYLSTKNPDKVFEYGEKLLAMDPDNFATAVHLVRAAQEKNDAARMFAYGEGVAAILTRYRAKTTPEGTDPSVWEQEKAKALADATDNINYVEYALFSSASQTRAPAARAALLERFVAAFPDSSYAASAQSLVAATYQQAQNYPKMLDFAQRILARDPKNLGMMLLLSDYFSEKGEQLDQAEEFSKKALELLEAAPKPEGAAEEQWRKQISLQKGLAWSALGQVQINRKRDAQALEAFRTAAPLLKSDATTYARNQYRMGFALLNLKRPAEARTALTEAASLDSPYKTLAEEKLKSLASAPTRPARKRP